MHRLVVRRQRLEEEQQQRVAQYRQAGHRPGISRRQCGGGDRQRQQIQRNEGIGRAAAQIQQRGQAGDIGQELEKKLRIANRNALAQSHPRSHVDRNEYRNDRTHRREGQRRMDKPVRDGYGENLASDHDAAQQEQAPQVGYRVDRIHGGPRMEGKGQFYSIGRSARPAANGRASIGDSSIRHTHPVTPHHGSGAGLCGILPALPAVGKLRRSSAGYPLGLAAACTACGRAACRWKCGSDKKSQRSAMKIHEYQAKEILRNYGVITPRGVACFSVDEAVAATGKLGGKVWVVKAQIHAGGRGKGGGVKVAKSIDEVREWASKILGMQLKTHQTGPEGQKVRRLLIEEGADIRKELYIGLVVDRGTQEVCVMASSEGGMDIEEVAAHTPEKIHKVFVDPQSGLADAQADDLARKIGIPDASLPQARAILKSLYKAFWDTDASLAEINPLILTGSGDVVALDAKMNFDDNALYRHEDIVAMRDLDEEDPA